MQTLVTDRIINFLVEFPSRSAPTLDGALRGIVSAIDRARNYLLSALSPSPAVSPFFLLDGKEDGRWRVNAVVNRRSASHKTQQITLRELF